MRSFWTFTDRTPAKQAVEDVLIQVEGMALWMDGAEIFKVCTRFGATDTNIYLDLADRQWRCVEVTLDGWSVVTDPLIKFRRCRGILPLPEPQHGGSLNELRDFINVDDDQFVLVVACNIPGLGHLFRMFAHALAGGAAINCRHFPPQRAVRNP